MAQEISFEEAMGTPPVGVKPKAISFEDVAGNAAPEPEAAPPADTFLGRTKTAVVDVGWAVATHPGKAAVGGVKAVTAGVVSLGDLAMQGVTGLAVAAMDRWNQGKVINTDQMRGAFGAGADAGHEKIEAVKNYMSRITGVNLAPKNKEEEAMQAFLGILPDAVTAGGDTVYEKTGNALAGAGTQALLTLLMIRPGIAGKIFRGGAKVAEAADQVKYRPSKKVESVFDELAVKDPPAAEALAEHVGKTDPELGDLMLERAKEKAGASAEEQAEIGAVSARAKLDEEPTHEELQRQADEAEGSGAGAAGAAQALNVPGVTAGKLKARLVGTTEGGKPRVRMVDETSSYIREAVRDGHETLNRKEPPGGPHSEDPVIYMSGGSPITFGHIAKAFRVGERLMKEIPGAPILESKLREYYKQALTTFHPEGLGKEAEVAASTVAKAISQQMQKDSSYFHRAAGRRNFWSQRMPEARMFIDGFEKGQKFADPLLNKASEGYREWNREIFENDRRLGFTYEPQENYLYHMFEKGDEVASFLERKFGTKWSDPGFIKERSFEMYSQAVAAGYKPKFTNPEDIMLARQHASDAAQMKVQVLRDLETYGLAKRITKESKERPEDFPSSEWRSPTGERYWVHANADKVLHNAFETKSLWTMKGAVGDAFRGMMELKNRLVPIKLMLSLFHPLHVATIDNATGMVRASKELLAGTSNPARWMGQMGSAALYKGAISDTRGGYRILKAFQGKIKDSELTLADRQSLQYIAEGGSVPEMSVQYKSSAIKSFMDAIKRRSVTSAFHLPFAAVALLSKPMFEIWIPSLKIASYLKDVKTAVRVDPSLLESPLRRQLAFRRLSKSVDNRYGEMAYNTLFWNRWVKDLAVANTLSLGWQLGFLREYGGGALDIGQAIKGPGGVAAKAKSGMLDRPLFVTFYTTQALAYGGLLTWALTGKSPASLMDYIYPQSGEKNPDGSAQRLNTMFYPREFASIYKHMQHEGVVEGLTQAVENKASGLIGLMKEWATGVNSFGQEIRDPDAPAYKKLEQTLVSTLADLEPISIEAIQKQVSEHPIKTGALSVAGFSPAPKYVTESATEAAIKGTYLKYYASKQTPYEKAEYSGERHQLQKLYNADDPKYEDLLETVVDKYELTGKEQRRLERGIAKDEDPNVKMFQRMTWKQQKKILDGMTEDERETFLPHANKEHLRYSYEAPE